MRRWLFVSGLLVLLAGAALGFLMARALAPEETTATAVSPGGYFDPYSDAPLYLVTSEEVYQELGLGAEQRARIDRVLSSYFRDVRGVRSSLAALASDLRDGVASLLTPEQLASLEEIQQRYAKREIQLLVGREIARLRQPIELAPEQEARVYQVLFDSAVASREAWRCKPRRDRDAMRAEIEEIRARRDERLLDILEAEQFAAYSELKEREHRWWKRHRDRRQRSKEPSPEPAADVEGASTEPEVEVPAEGGASASTPPREAS